MCHAVDSGSKTKSANRLNLKVGQLNETLLLQGDEVPEVMFKTVEA